MGGAGSGGVTAVKASTFDTTAKTLLHRAPTAAASAAEGGGTPCLGALAELALREPVDSMARLEAVVRAVPATCSGSSPPRPATVLGEVRLAMAAAMLESAREGVEEVAGRGAPPSAREAEAAKGWGVSARVPA